jgi:hypothetical protein
LRAASATPGFVSNTQLEAELVHEAPTVKVEVLGLIRQSSKVGVQGPPPGYPREHEAYPTEGEI